MQSMFRSFSLAAAAVALMATPAVAGPPWIGIEIPANPLHPSSRGALLLVHAYHHGTPTGFPVTGTAEGLVGGQRRTQALAFTATTWPGVYALKYDPPRDGAWVLAITVRQGEERGDAATALVRIRDGEVVGVTVPTRGTGPRAVSPADVEAALRAHAAALAAAPSSGPRGRGALALAGLGLVGLCAVAVRQRRP